MSNYIHGKTRLVVCAANNYNGLIICGARHYDQVMVKQIKAFNDGFTFEPEQGFIDQHGVFMDRFEALLVATEAGQINRYREKTTPVDRLFSEDLY